MVQSSFDPQWIEDESTGKIVQYSTWRYTEIIKEEYALMSDIHCTYSDIENMSVYDRKILLQQLIRKSDEINETMNNQRGVTHLGD